MRLAHGTRGWIALAVGIAAFDVHAIATKRETLSAAFTRAIQHPTRRPWVLIAWGAITLHLLQGLWRRG